MPAAVGGRCGSGRRQQPATTAVEARTGAAEAELGYWGSRAQVAAGESGSAGGEGNEVNLKSQPPLLFIKVLGSRLVTGVDFAIIAKFSPKTWFTCKFEIPA